MSTRKDFLQNYYTTATSDKINNNSLITFFAIRDQTQDHVLERQALMLMSEIPDPIDSIFYFM